MKYGVKKANNWLSIRKAKDCIFSRRLGIQGKLLFGYSIVLRLFGKTILLLLLPFIGFGQVIITERPDLTLEWQTPDINAFSSWTHYKIDTIPVLMLVSDANTYKAICSCGSSTPPPGKAYCEYDYKDYTPKVLEGYLVTRTLRYEYWEDYYLDDKKKPLSKNYIVWQSINK